MLASGLVLFALGPEPIGGTNLNILAVPSMGMGLDLLEQASLAQLKAVAEGQIDSERVTLPAGEALHLRYAVRGAGRADRTERRSVHRDRRQSQLIISVTNAAAGEAAAIAQSLELLP